MWKMMKGLGCWRVIMKTFKQYLIAEGKYPTWLRITVGVMAMKVRNLSDRIENETDPIKQNALIAKQNKLVAYMNGLSIATGTSDKRLMQRMRTKGLN
jgi:hypothetical protein